MGAIGPPMRGTARPLAAGRGGTPVMPLNPLAPPIPNWEVKGWIMKIYERRNMIMVTGKTERLAAIFRIHPPKASEPGRTSWSRIRGEKMTWMMTVI